MPDPSLHAAEDQGAGVTLPPAPEVTPPVARVKHCVGCNEVQPIGNFYVTKKKIRVAGVLKVAASRMKLCKACKAKDQQKRTKNKRKAVRDEIINRLARQATSAKIDVMHISELGALLTKDLGGPEEATKAWADSIKITAELNPEKGARLYEAWARIIKWSTENRQTAPDVANMTDDDLKRELDRAIRETGEGLCGEN